MRLYPLPSQSETNSACDSASGLVVYCVITKFHPDRHRAHVGQKTRFVVDTGPHANVQIPYSTYVFFNAGVD